MFRRLISPPPSLRTQTATRSGSIRLNNTIRHFSISQNLKKMAEVKLYSYGTPNGVVASILLEELKEAYGGPSYE